MTSQKFSIFKPNLSKILVALLTAPGLNPENKFGVDLSCRFQEKRISIPKK